ncbi:hypothetical protein DEO72_LG11g1921 [Vigna unguiculata]|uniref:Uncharacterized protein n=1 Tax=Vigna unguiculata TaxID=3917 RepID=A0A4D6NRL1_VIGUN|nr:hypothetical protein DEO72_LG11g1921 [Vigna unguiculata]
MAENIKARRLLLLHGLTKLARAFKLASIASSTSAAMEFFTHLWSSTMAQMQIAFELLLISADPSGNEESGGDAILKAMEDAFGLQMGYEMVAGVNDLGGVVIDLEGGNYKISKPITFPSGGANIVLLDLCWGAGVCSSVSGVALGVIFFWVAGC